MAARASVPQSGASTSTLARMASLALGANKKAEDDEDAKGKSKSAEDDEEDKDKKKDDAKSEDKKDGEDAEDKKDDDEASEDDEDDKAEKDGDDDSDEDDKADKKARAARGRERGRIAAIITSKAAQRSTSHYSMAVNLALNTKMTRGEAIALLGGMPDTPAAAEPAKPTGQAARDRLSTAPNPDVGASDGGGDGKGPNLAAQIVAAGKKRRGEA